MKKQAGFTLIELMIVIGIIAILSAIAIPGYQGYIQKAALTDMLQSAIPYKTAVELCIIERGNSESCSSGASGIPEVKSSRYINSMTVIAGVITMSGRENLHGLNIILKPEWNRQEGIISWQKACNSSSESLKNNCRALFRFDDAEGD